MTNTITKKAANSIVGKLTAGILAVAAVFLAFSAPAYAAAAPVLVIGDSLEVGSGPYLRGALGPVSVEVDAKRGRTSSEGVRLLGSELRPEHEVVVFPLGTNDLSAPALAASLTAARELAGGRCLVVATIARPNLRGSSTAALNRVIERFAGSSAAQVTDWRSAVGSTPGLLGRDRIHATDQGYALRGSLLAEAVQGCLVGGELGGIPAPENPDVKVPRQRRSPPPRPRPVGVKLPAPLLAFDAMVERCASLVGAAAADALTAATRGRPEPVLGAPGG